MSTQGKAQKASRLPRGTLDRDAVLAAALALADREGVAGVSMPRVAAELECTPMALYRHVRDKQELVGAIAELALSEIPPISQDSRPWRARLEEFALRMREACLRHPALAEIALDHGVYGPAATSAGLHVMAALHEAGFDEDAAIRGFMALRNHSLGAVAWEISRFRHGSAQFRRRELEEFVRRDTPADSPLWHFSDVVADDPEVQYRFGITCLLDGFEAELRRAKKRAGAGKRGTAR